MGEHGTWFDYLNRFAWWQSLSESARHLMERNTKWMLFQDTHFTLTPFLVALTVLLFVIYGVTTFKRGITRASDGGLIPPRSMNIRNLFESLAESVYGMVEGQFGKENAPRFFPLIGALFLFVLFGNFIGLLPGFVTPNDTLKTNLALALLVFVATHVYGIKEHGVAYLKHFIGPSLPLAPLMLPVEIISHIARPFSLALRLMGNMVADHKVLFTFFSLVPLLIPLPFYFLGMFICFVQALVFCTLSMVYISMAIEHEEH